MKSVMKKCELCSDPATMYCESDTASLCLSCDAKVHGANFLVAKHERCLLCSVCQMQTEWKASGPRLGRTATICDGCVNSKSAVGKAASVGEEREEEEAVVESQGDYGGGDLESESSSDEDDDEEDDDDDDEDEDEDEEEEEEEDDEENQVVPWSSGEEMTSSSGNVGSGSGSGGGESDRSSKRRRLSSDLESEDEEGVHNSIQMMRRRRAEGLGFINNSAASSRPFGSSNWVRSTAGILSGNRLSSKAPGITR